MANLQPFKGIRYNLNKVKLEEVITEPYDRITPGMQEDYYARSPYNIVRIILGKDEEPGHPEKDKYRRARLYLDEWLKEGAFIREDRKSFYLYEQEFSVRGETKKRCGLVARVELEDFSSRKVLPHERTFPRHKEDRLRLLRATQTNTEQIFLLYKDDEKKVEDAIKRAREKADPVAEVYDEDCFLHRLWAIKDEEDIKNIQERMKERVLIIADGHHRYETSQNYQREMVEKTGKVSGEEPFNYVMMTLFSIDDPGLVILPTYRLIKGLERLREEALKKVYEPLFEISDKSWTDDREYRKVMVEIRNAVEKENHFFAVHLAGTKKFLLLKLRNEELLEKEIREEKPWSWKTLDVAILHSLLIDKLKVFTDEPFILENNVSYIRNLEEGMEKVRQGEFQMIFLLKPASLSQIRDVVESGELMPHKSTDFFPKLKSGLILNPLDE